MALNHRALAELGARAEVSRLSIELLGIVSEFPTLGHDAATRLAPLLKNGRTPRPAAATPAPTTNGTARRKGGMSAKARREMSARMRKRWRAAKKAGKSTLQKAATEAK